MKKVIYKFKNLMKNINISYIDEHAAGCAYYTILAFIPLILLILTLTKYIGISEQIFIYVLEGMIPSEILNDAIISIVKETYSKSLSTITISAVVTLWSAGKGFFALCKGLSVAYQLETQNRYIRFRLRAIFSTIIFIFTIVLSLLLLVFGNSINMFLKEKFNIYSSILNFISIIKIPIGIILLTIIFTIMYKFIPKHKYRLKNQIPGALFSAIACNVISIFYSIYVEIFTGFSFMYGSLTTVVLAMMWVYACMYSILIGGCINKFIEEKRMKRA